VAELVDALDSKSSPA